MTRKDAFDLVQRYISGWKDNNLLMITSCLDKNCVVIESHGPTYHGISDIERWFEFWLKANSKIKKWDICSFHFCEEEKIAFVEWDFSCISNEIEYALPGISLVKFREDKISFVQEYRMTHQAYNWNGDELKSE